MNEKGNAFFFSIVLMLLLSSVGLIFIKKRLIQVKRSTEKQKLLLCAKSTNGKTSQFIRFIQKTDLTIAALTTASTASVFIPGYGQIASQSFKKVRRIVQKSQVASLFSYLNFIRLKTKQKCTFSPFIYRTPYKLSFKSGFERNLIGQTKKRGHNWSYFNIGKRSIIVNKYNLNKIKIKSYFASKEMLGL